MTSKILTITGERESIAYWADEHEVEIEDDTGAYRGNDPDNPGDFVAGRIDADQIPIGAIIDGIYVRIRKRQTDNLNAHDYEVGILNGWTRISDDKANPDRWPDYVWFDTYYGSANDLWGTSITAADLNSGTYAVGIRTIKIGGSLAIITQIDYIEITVYYTGGVTPPTGENPYGPLVQVI